MKRPPQCQSQEGVKPVQPNPLFVQMGKLRPRRAEGLTSGHRVVSKGTRRELGQPLFGLPGGKERFRAAKAPLALPPQI